MDIQMELDYKSPNVGEKIGHTDAVWCWSLLVFGAMQNMLQSCAHKPDG